MTVRTASSARTRRGTLTAALAGACALALTACGTSVLDLEVGQCISESTTEDEVSSVPIVDCAEPHKSEVYALPQMSDGEYPGLDAAYAQADEVCTGPAFTEYVGVPYLQSELYLDYLAPSEETWAMGDREIVCLLTTQDDSDLTGSLRNANR